jgi:hypothetical protein
MARLPSPERPHPRTVIGNTDLPIPVEKPNRALDASDNPFG